MTPLDEIWRHLRRDRLEDLLERAVREYSPSYAEDSVLPIFTEALEGAGVEVHHQKVPGRENDPERTNLVVRLGPQPPALLWVGHVDTVPLVDDDHLRCEREGDILWGLGTADMKSGCAAIVEVITAVREAGIEPRRGLCVGLVVGEEETGDGAQVLAREVTAPLTVIGEPTSLMPCVDHYGYLELRLVASGERAHAAVPEVGASAIHAMLVWLTSFIDACAAHDQRDGIAVSVRDISGGSRMFMVADRCEAVVNVHLRPDLGPELIEQLARAHAAAAGTAVDVQRLHWAPGYTNPADPRLEPLSRAYGAIGRPWVPVAFRSHSDACLFVDGGGSPPVICGPGALEVAHRRDEHVSLDEVFDAARLYAALVYEACIA